MSADTPLTDLSAEPVKDEKKSAQASKVEQKADDGAKDPLSSFRRPGEEPYDPTAPLVEKKLPGPGNNQRVTDCFCLLLFFMFWFGMVMLGATAFEKGNPLRLTRGTDMYGGICGTNSTLPLHDLTNKPVLVFPNPFTLDVSYCAEKCPEVLQNPFDPFSFNPEAALCPYYPEDGAYVTPKARLLPALRLKVPDAEAFTPPGITLNPDTWLALYNNFTDDPLYEILYPNMFPLKRNGSICYFSYIADEVQGRCFPSIDNLNSTAEAAIDNEYVQNTIGLASKVMADFVRAWPVILGLCLGAFFFAFVWLGILNLFAKAFIHLTLAVVFALLLLGTLFAFFNYYDLVQQTKVDPDLLNDKDFTNWQTAVLVFSIVLAVTTVVYVCFVLWIYKSLKLALELMDEASVALRYCWQILLSPLFTLVGLAMSVAWVFAVWVCLETAGTTVVDANGEFQGYEPDKVLQGMRYYLLFGFYWTNNFIIGVQQMAMAGCVALWYFSPKVEHPDGKNTSQLKEKLRFPLWISYKNTFLYHAGSVAFGACLIAIVQFIKYFVDKIRENIEAKDSTLRCFMCLLKCAVCCLEKILKFITKNAYIVIAVTGDKPFLAASKAAFFLLLENAKNLMVVQGVSSFLLFMGKVFVTVTCGVIAAFILSNDSEINFWGFPTAVVVLLAYFLGGYFFEVYQTCIDTIFICLCWDMKMAAKGDAAYQDGIPWVPGDLEQFVEKKVQDGKQKGGGCVIL